MLRPRCQAAGARRFSRTRSRIPVERGRSPPKPDSGWPPAVITRRSTAPLRMARRCFASMDRGRPSNPPTPPGWQTTRGRGPRRSARTCCFVRSSKTPSSPPCATSAARASWRISRNCEKCTKSSVFRCRCSTPDRARRFSIRRARAFSRSTSCPSRRCRRATSRR